VIFGRIALPERCANVCFGGLKRNRLFMAASLLREHARR
jgi:gluconolactonase